MILLRSFIPDSFPETLKEFSSINAIKDPQSSGEMIKYHITEKGISIAETLPGSEMINFMEDNLETLDEAISGLDK